MFNTQFGIEIEMTGITKNKAAKVVAKYFETYVPETSTGYLEELHIKDSKNRTWKIVTDSSIRAQRKASGQYISASGEYKVELVSPPLRYEEDITDLQQLVRQLRKAGAFARNENHCGIHIHLDGAPHTVRSLKNFIKIIASKEDLLYDALQFNPARQHWCRKTDREMMRRLEQIKPKTMQDMIRVWYGSSCAPRRHYDETRYHFLNLHSYFQIGGNHTIELRGFNATLHAGEIRSYIVLALALNHQALTQTCASARSVQRENKKFAMRTYLNRIGLSGKEFKNCRMHLTKHLDGDSAWRFNTAA